MTVAESWRQVNIRCPFFKGEDGQKKSLLCEGILDGSILSSKFRSRKKYEQQLSSCCEESYTKCELYKAIMQAKYKEP